MDIINAELSYSEEERVEIARINPNNSKYTLKSALISRPFLLICLMAILSSTQNYFINGAWKAFALYQMPGILDSSLSWILFYGAFFNSLSRLIFGFSKHYFTFKALYSIILVVQILIALTINSVATTYYVYVGYICLVFLCEGGHICLFPILLIEVFGLDLGAKLFPVVY